MLVIIDTKFYLHKYKFPPPSCKKLSLALPILFYLDLRLNWIWLTVNFKLTKPIYKNWFKGLDFCGSKIWWFWRQTVIVLFLIASVRTNKNPCSFNHVN